MLIFVFSIIMIFSFPYVESDKQPVWEWASSSAITNTDISNDSKNISATYARSVSLWINDTSIPYDTKTEGDGIRYMEMSSNGEYVITGEEIDKTLTLRTNGSKLWSKSDFLSSLNGIDISDSGDNITAIDFRNVYFFNKESNEEIWNSYIASQEMTSVAISPDGRYIAAGTLDGNVYVYLSSDVEDTWYHSDPFDGKITKLDFSGDSSHLVIGTSSGRVHVYPSEGGNPITVANSEEITCISANSNSEYYLYGTNDGLVRLLDRLSESNIWQKNMGSKVTDCSFNGRGNHILAGSENGVVLLTNVDGEELWRTTVSGAVHSVSLSFKGENIVIGSDSGLSTYYEPMLDNQAPIAVIESLQPSISLPGESISFKGSGIDSDGYIVNFHWHSSIDGNLSFEQNFSLSNLSMGLHLIFLRVQDNEGRWSSPISINLGVGDFPEASIISVSNCTNLEECIIDFEEEIFIQANASSETSEAIFIVTYEWSSSIDGIISNQLNFSSSELSIGIHTINFRVKNNLGFWSSNATLTIVVNGIPSIVLDKVNPNPVVAGETVQLAVIGEDPDSDLLSYFWSSDKGDIASEGNLSILKTDSQDYGESKVSVYVQDSRGSASKILNITIQVISLPNIVDLSCDSEVKIGEEANFIALATKPKGSIVKYEWDFDSLSGDVDSVDSLDFSTTHIYNSSSPDLDGYLVVLKVTDNDGLEARKTCQVLVSSGNDVGDSSNDSSSIISNLTGPVGLLALVTFLLAIGGFVYYYNKEDLDLSDYTAYPPVSKEDLPSDSINSEEQVVEEESSKRVVKKKRIIKAPIQEMMTVECPQCSSQIEITKVSGSQPIQCPDCGLEGEIEV